MLNAYLEMLCEKEKTAAQQLKLVGLLQKLPEEEVMKIAYGGAIADCYDSEKCWTTQFEGTPMHEQALQLEQQDLELQIQKKQKDLAESEQTTITRAEDHAFYDQQDALRLQKRILELELNKAKLEAAGAPPMPMAGAPPAPEPPMPGPAAGPPSGPAAPEPGPTAKEASALLLKAAAEHGDSLAYRGGAYQGLIHGAVEAGKKKEAAMQAGHFDDELIDALVSSQTPELARANALAAIQQHLVSSQQLAANSEANPLRHRAGGAAAGGLLGAIPGALVGGAFGRPGLGALLGGSLGALGGGLHASPENFRGMANDAAAAHGSLMASGGVHGPLKGHASDVLLGRSGFDTDDSPARQRALAYLQAGDPKPEKKKSKPSTKEASAKILAALEKEANFGAALQGLKGAGGFLAKAAPQVVGAARSGGMGGLGAALKQHGAAGLSAAGKWAGKNPMAAGILGAGAVGTAAAGGAAVS